MHCRFSRPFPLQSVVQNFAPAPRAAVLPTRLRDLQLAVLRLAPPFDALAEGYRAALAEFLEQNKIASPVAPVGRHPASARETAGLAETLAKLDALDARRRDVEARFDSLSQTRKPDGP